VTKKKLGQANNKYIASPARWNNRNKASGNKRSNICEKGLKTKKKKQQKDRATRKK